MTYMSASSIENEPEEELERPRKDSVAKSEVEDDLIDKYVPRVTSTTWFMLKRYGACESDFQDKVWFVSSTASLIKIFINLIVYSKKSRAEVSCVSSIS